MIVNCSECNKEVSHKAQSCPHCGNPTSEITNASLNDENKKSTFQILAAIAFIVTLFTPKIIATIPILATLILCSISLIKLEKRTLLTWVLILLTLAILISPSSLSNSLRSSNYQLNKEVIISSFNWEKDATFGSDGAVIWNVEVHNKSNKYLKSVRVSFSTYDKQDNIITSGFSYVSTIPPGQKRATKGYADFYGTEETAKAYIVRVNN